MAVIAGTGVAEHFRAGKSEEIRTEFGSAFVRRLGRGSFLMPRHGPGHGVPPHMVNYRANISALRSLGITSVIATGAVGSMSPRLGVGEFGLLGQFIDFTRRREGTFFDEGLAHTDVTEPYDRGLNRLLRSAAKEAGVKVREGLVYVCTDGPRFETAAEVRMFRRMGGEVVGMTGVPEVVLANELGMKYSSVVVATNWAAGIQGGVSHEGVTRAMKKAGPVMREVVEITIKRVKEAGRG
ncbi:MAG: MTAP family purine nucleoside phosphorylase [Thaumarchaeota archaeon]|nr:MTAP family purine nucleoside phosphorylase [Nitrososphaerota archaeon]